MIGVINATRVDFDRKLDWTSLGDNVSLHYDEVGVDPVDEVIIHRASGCEILVTKEIKLPSSLISNLPDTVRLICEAGTGYNNIALEACKSRGISVMNVPSYSNSAVASLVITFVLNFSCSLIQQHRSLFADDIGNFTTSLRVPHFELAGKTIGLIGGRGSIGSKVTELARALRMIVIISSREPPAENTDGVHYTTSVDDLLQRSDFVSLHCPLNDSTRHIINTKTISLMKPTAYLINTARGGLIDESALITALIAQKIAGAALDVQDPEPPVPSSPLYTLPNVILTPHIGWKRLETRQRLINSVADNIMNFRAGRLSNVVN